MNNRIRLVSVLLFLIFLMPDVHAQLSKITDDLDSQKPAKYKDLTLKSEKTGQKKFTVPRRFIQNTVSHYNYFFNANQKINSVIERARLANVDDYSKLLSYYSYSLDNTASQKTDLDSVIYKATAGILLHDLRSNWVDNLYLLIGEAYFFRKTFDSADITFQFINYNLYPRKKGDDDDQLIVGSNENPENHSVSIVSNEKENIIKKTFSRPPSRNDALIWMIRAWIDEGKYADAAGLINTLRNDPLFPKRLNPYFNEMEGYWFFKQQMYDSATLYIKNALPNAIDVADRARREYLLAQLYELNHHQDTASYYYDKVIKLTTDPLMYIYANLNKAKMLKNNDSAEIDKGIARLLHMAHKDRFESYRDIIYYSAAQLALEKPDTSAGVSFYKKSTFYNQDDISLKNKAFLTLAEISYQQKKYKDAYNFYDSLQMSDTSLVNLEEIQSRKNALEKVVTNLNIIDREDSLQAIAALSPADRNAFLKKLSKKLKKERGIKDEDLVYSSANSNSFNNQNPSSGIFTNSTNQGEWYFDNNDLKSKGYSEFQSLWGKRKNVDNWRRASASNQNGGSSINQNQANANNGDPMAPQKENFKTKSSLGIPYQDDISVDGLLANVPLTKPAMDTSNSKIARSLFKLGKNYQDLLEDYYAAIDAYQRSLKRFPDSLYNGELYMNLSYCYRQIGNLQQADFYKNLLLSNFQKSIYTQYVLHPDSFDPSKKDTVAENRYDKIYNLFIEGNFDEAIREKHIADSLYGKSYWNPQLLYIQSVYYIHNNQDSAAIITLHEIIDNYPKSPMKNKAATMIDVLGRRKSIESYLTNLKVVRDNPDSQIVVFDDSKIINNVQSPVIMNQKVITQNGVVKPGKATLNPNIKLAPPVKNAEFIFDPNEAQNVMMVLTKVDPVYSSEAKNAFNRYNSQNNYSLNIQIAKDTLDTNRILLIFSPFIDADVALKYLDQLKSAAPSEISWLPVQKYAFYIISDANLELLKENKNLQSYIDLLHKKYPGKF
ncbi:MAG TPA: tetratricopeptide repeat protein [Hanamia sp.]|nr:tetratricopeptide repeat protein [Hanamia sp.]